jgi:hypothetical protein
MNRLLDDSLVIVVLLASVAYAMSSLGPKGLRRRMGFWLARLAARMRLGGLARRLDQRAAAKSAGACGGCETCGGDAAEEKSPSAEIRVPVSKIGRL